MANLTHAELVTPERVLFSGEAEAVIMRVDGGDTTFLANHSDFIGAVDICVVRIQAAREPVAGSRLAARRAGVAPAEVRRRRLRRGGRRVDLARRGSGRGARRLCQSG